MKESLVILTVLVAASALALPVLASDSVEVTATVTPEQISISFWSGTPTTVNYGTLPFGVTDRAPVGDPAIKVWNSGTVQEDFGIRGANATAVGGSPWVLESAPGQDKYTHKFCAGSHPGVFTPLTDSALANKITGAGGISPNQNTDFMLRFSMPTSATTYTSNQYSTTVTILATAH